MKTKKQFRKMLELAKEVHKNQKRKYSGLPYISHPISVARRVARYFYKQPINSEDFWDLNLDGILAVAVGHDVIEDFEGSREDIIKRLKDEGFSDLIIAGIQMLSKGEDETYFDFITRISEVSDTPKYIAVIKFFDIEHNMSTLEEGSLKDKYRFAQWMIEWFQL